MKKIICTLCALISIVSVQAQNKYDNPDTLVVSRDGTGEFRDVTIQGNVLRRNKEEMQIEVTGGIEIKD